MPSVSCPVCGQRGRTDDLNHFEPRGTLQRRAAVMCSVCGSGLSIGRGPFGARARLIDQEQWAAMARAAGGPGGAVQPLDASASERAKPSDAETGLEALSSEIIGALEAMRRLPIAVDDERSRRVDEELMTALVWTRDLLIELRTEREAPPI